jgi:hypothetical protein
MSTVTCRAMCPTECVASVYGQRCVKKRFCWSCARMGLGSQTQAFGKLCLLRKDATVLSNARSIYAKHRDGKGGTPTPHSCTWVGLFENVDVG